jgi:DNA-binding response OmpR family regulator
MQASSTQWPDQPSLAGRRILIVEDEYYLADDLEQTLRGLGAEIAGPVGEVREALHILAGEGAIDGAVLDINLRNELIFPVARELRARAVPFVFTSGYDKIPGGEFADVPLWEKPIDVTRMARWLANMIHTY